MDGSRENAGCVSQAGCEANEEWWKSLTPAERADLTAVVDQGRLEHWEDLPPVKRRERIQELLKRSDGTVKRHGGIGTDKENHRSTFPFGGLGRRYDSVRRHCLKLRKELVRFVRAMHGTVSLAADSLINLAVEFQAVVLLCHRVIRDRPGADVEKVLARAAWAMTARNSTLDRLGVYAAQQAEIAKSGIDWQQLFPPGGGGRRETRWKPESKRERKAS